MSEIIIDKNAKQITFTNNGICFSQFGIANEVLDLIEKQIKEIERLHSIIKEVREYIDGTDFLRIDNYSFRIDDMRFVDNIYKILDKVDKEKIKNE